MAPRLRASENQQKIKYLSTESSDALFFVHNPKCEFFRACNSRLTPSVGCSFRPLLSQNTPRRETKGPQHICIWTTIGSINFCSLSSRMCPMSMRKNGSKKKCIRPGSMWGDVCAAVEWAKFCHFATPESAGCSFFYACCAWIHNDVQTAFFFPGRNYAVMRCMELGYLVSHLVFVCGLKLITANWKRIDIPGNPLTVSQRTTSIKI